MGKRFYLQRVVLWLTDGALMAHFVELIEKLQDVGIAVEALLTEERAERRDNTLYITDSGACASWLKEENLPILAYLHENNQGEDFGGMAYAMENAEEIEPEYLERVYRRYLDLPWDILSTARCDIRETVVADVDEFMKIYSEPSITQYTEGLYEDPEQEKAYIRDYIDKMYHFYEYGVWTVLHRESGEIIGRAGFSVREGSNLPELGFVIACPWQRKGIAYEICSAILAFGSRVLGFHKVQTLVRPENKASLALCAKLGFVEQKRVRERDYISGEEWEYCYLIWVG